MDPSIVTTLYCSAPYLEEFYARGSRRIFIEVKQRPYTIVKEVYWYSPVPTELALGGERFEQAGRNLYELR